MALPAKPLPRRQSRIPGAGLTGVAGSRAPSRQGHLMWATLDRATDRATRQGHLTGLLGEVRIADLDV